MEAIKATKINCITEEEEAEEKESTLCSCEFDLFFGGTVVG